MALRLFTSEQWPEYCNEIAGQSFAGDGYT
jgi:hypothetical protein